MGISECGSLVAVAAAWQRLAALSPDLVDVAIELDEASLLVLRVGEGNEVPTTTIFFVEWTQGTRNRKEIAAQKKPEPDSPLKIRKP